MDKRKKEKKGQNISQKNLSIGVLHLRDVYVLVSWQLVLKVSKIAIPLISFYYEDLF